MELREEYLKSLEAQMQDWRVKIRQLEVMAHRAEPNTRAGYYYRIGELLSSVQQLESRVSRLKTSSKRSFKRLQAGIETVRYDVDDAVSYALKNIQ